MPRDDAYPELSYWFGWATGFFTTHTNTPLEKRDQQGHDARPTVIESQRAIDLTDLRRLIDASRADWESVRHLHAGAA
jgi:hypothetical protein